MYARLRAGRDCKKARGVCDLVRESLRGLAPCGQAKTPSAAANFFQLTGARGVAHEMRDENASTYMRLHVGTRVAM
jgi:hypothetical protein